MNEATEFPIDVDQFEALIDDLPIGVLILDDDGIIRRFNRYEEQLSGRSREQTIGKSFFSDVAPCTKDIELGPRFHEGIENGSLDLSVEFSFPYPYNRVPRDVHIRARSVSQGERVAHVVLIEDITSRRQLQRNNTEIMSGLRAMLKQQGLSDQSVAHPAAGFGSDESVEREAFILHADLVGIRRAAATLSPGELFPVLDRRMREAVDTIHRRGGRVDVVQGDSLVAYFLPRDDGERTIFDAARAGWAIVGGGERKELELPFRVGLAAGKVFNGLIGRKEFGERVTVGAPIMMAREMAQLGRARELIVDAEVYERLGEAVVGDLVQGPASFGAASADEMWRVDRLDLPDEL